MEREIELTEERKSHLLKEYELCQDAAQSLESTIWQTGAAIGLGSIGTIVLAANVGIDWFVGLIVGSAIIASTVVWWYMARRWWSIQQTKYCRMLDIEHAIGLYQTRYLKYLDELLDPQQTETVDRLRETLLPPGCASHPEKDCASREKLGTSSKSGLAKRHQRRGTQAILIWLLPINIVLWSLYVFYLFFVWVFDPFSW